LPVADTESLTREQLVLEELALKLRTTAGLDLASIEERFGVELAGPNGAVVERLKQTGLLDSDTERLVPTLKGLAVADTLAASFEIVTR
jgi:oxygen-independent coproporphyrinogen-3 oxidase